MSRPLHVCECGQLNEAALDAIRARDEMIEIQRGTISDLEGELRGKRAAITRLKGEGRVHPDADEVLGYWSQTLMPKAKDLTGRRKPVTERLYGGYTKADLIRCIDGYALKQYVVQGRRCYDGPKDCRKVEPSLIFRSPEHVQRGLDIADQADDLRQMFAETDATLGDATLTRVPSGSRDPIPGLLSALGEAALRAAGRGLAVFPCRPRDKRPATAHGLLDAKRDVVAIRRAWQLNPDLNIAIPTGAVNGLIVLDIDGDEGWDSLHALQDRHEELPDTLSVQTPRGGHHFYFTAPGTEIRNTTGFPGTAMDIRGDGGYVLIPPSVGPGGRVYEKDEDIPPAPMPAWLTELLVGRQRDEAKTLLGGRDWGEFVNDGVSQGDRNARMISYVGHMLSLGHMPKEVMAHVQVWNQAKVQPPLGPRELKTIVESGVRMHHRGL